MDFIGGTNTLLNYQFMESGEPFVPDVGSVTYTVYNHAGTAMSGLINVPVTTTVDTFQILISINALNNSIAAGKNFERRTVMVTFSRNGLSQSKSIQYRLIPMMNYSVQPNDVRAFIGLQDHELPDEDIDLVKSYLYVESYLGDTAIEPLLSSGTILELAVNNAIKAQAVLDVLPSVRQRVAQEETNGVIGFKRLLIKDFADVEAKALGLLSGSLTELLVPLEQALIMVLTTGDADPITGA